MPEMLSFMLYQSPSYIPESPITTSQYAYCETAFLSYQHWHSDILVQIQELMQMLDFCIMLTGPQAHHRSTHQMPVLLQQLFGSKNKAVMAAFYLESY